MSVKDEMYEMISDLLPIHRSITGDGARETLSYIRDQLSGLVIYGVPSGEVAFDWTVPDEWNIKNAYITDELGNKIVDFKENYLHVVGYSDAVDTWVNLEELNKHLYSLVEQPTAIPYVTSYYSRCWGFCISHNQREKLVNGMYHVVIESSFHKGFLNYGEVIISGETKEEVMLSTYVCHPSMANNELSGIVVTIALTQWLKSLNRRKYTYRIVFIPETIGSIVYLSKNLSYLKQHVIAGFNVTCIGDERCYSYMPSRNSNTLSDHVAQHVLKHTDKSYKKYTWLDRGSDERQYCAPGVDLPIATIMRSKYGEYPEYHTSLDNLDLVTPDGLMGGFIALQRAIKIIEYNQCLNINTLCEPQLGKRGLYPQISTKKTRSKVYGMMNFISYCDGTKTILEIANLINEPFWDLLLYVEELKQAGLLFDCGLSEPK